MIKNQNNERLYNTVNRALYILRLLAYGSLILMCVYASVLCLIYGIKFCKMDKVDFLSASCAGGYAALGLFCLALFFVGLIIYYSRCLKESIKDKHILHYREDGKCSICGKTKYGDMDAETKENKERLYRMANGTVYVLRILGFGVLTTLSAIATLLCMALSFTSCKVTKVDFMAVRCDKGYVALGYFVLALAFAVATVYSFYKLKESIKTKQVSYKRENGELKDKAVYAVKQNPCADGNHDVHGCVCVKCGKEFHSWDGCICVVCGKYRNDSHDYEDGICKKCGKAYDKYEEVCVPSWTGIHEFNEDGKCIKCGRHREEDDPRWVKQVEERQREILRKECEMGHHIWEYIGEGEAVYQDGYGYPEIIKVNQYKCRRCGAVKDDGHDFWDTYSQD